MRLAVLDALLAARQARQPAALITDRADGRQVLLCADKIEGGSPLDAEAGAAVQECLMRDRSAMIETNARTLFVHVFNPPPRLIVVGAVHIALALARMAAMVGYDVTIIDPRRGFAEREAFADFTVHTGWPDAALAELRPDARTAVVTLTHDPKLDDPALRAALRSGAFYVGALGSTKTHEARCRRLRADGCSEEELRRIHGPVGLRIGAVSPEEIAVSILAEVTAVRRKGATA